MRRQTLLAVAGLLAVTCALQAQVPSPSITTVTLPVGTVSVAYSFTLMATGGALPYRWAVIEGALPAGLDLNPTTGLISGTPTTAGTGVAQIALNDARQRSASKVFQWTVNPAPLAITTASPLPSGTVGTAYSQPFVASGGTSPYTWSSTAVFPTGLTLSPAGLLSGTPAVAGKATFTVMVTDAAKPSASVSKAFSLTIGVPAAPTLSVTGLTDTVNPAQQPAFDVQLNSAYSLPITGTITLAFTPDAIAPANDPSIQFSAGGRTLSFTIAAGQTRAFPSSAPAIQTGTVAGRIDLTVRFSAGGQDITPTPAPGRSVQIARTAPKINSVQITNKTSTGFNVVVTGYSTPRQVTQAIFAFTPASGASLQTTQVTVSVDSAFTTWFGGTSSAQFGSSFLYTQPFTVSGSLSAISSVSVTLVNATGSSAASSVSF